ncbi:MAG: hypothetical protein ACPKQO_07290, partial [Nitrososphaeraceae archaeon]
MVNSKSITLTIVMFGTLLPGMFFSMPGMSTGSHSLFQTTNMAFAQTEEYKGLVEEYQYNYADQYGYDNYSYDYEKKKKNFAEIERFDDKLFVCDNGIVVDDRTQCPLKCPFGTTLDGAYVMDLE